MSYQIMWSILGYAYFGPGGNTHFSTTYAPPDKSLPTDIGYHEKSSSPYVFVGSIVRDINAPGAGSNRYITIALICGAVLLVVLLVLLLVMWLTSRAMRKTELRYWRLRQTELNQERERRLLPVSSSSARPQAPVADNASLRRVPSAQSNMSRYSSMSQMQPQMARQQSAPMPRRMSMQQQMQQQQQQASEMQRVAIYTRPPAYVTSAYPAAPPQMMSQRVPSFTGPVPRYPPSRSFVENMAQRFDQPVESTNATNNNNEYGEADASGMGEHAGGTGLRRRSSRVSFIDL